MRGCFFLVVTCQNVERYTRVVTKLGLLFGHARARLQSCYTYSPYAWSVPALEGRRGGDIIRPRVSWTP